jgi:PilZ domain
MSAFVERRRGRRVAIPGRPGGRVRATLEARLLDLGSTGARIEHHNLLRLGFSCTLELPPALGALVLSVRVVRSAVVGTEAGPSGERLLRYESGLAFLDLTADQQATLEGVLDRLASGEALGSGRLVL